jgi:hypothetical protein
MQEEEEEKFSDDPTENMKIENEFLKIKLKAQYGDGFFMQEGEHAIPPELENQFLKQMMHFEENYQKAEFVPLYEKIGKPSFKKAEDLNEIELSNALMELIKTMEEHAVMLDINDGPYPDELIYKFITEELFEQEIEKESLFGGNWHFSYEEFHPNDKAEIERNTNEFLEHWFTKEFNEYSSELDYYFTTPDGKELDREAFFKKINMFFDSFVAFKNESFTIDKIDYKLFNTESGEGLVEGNLQYDAEMENAEIINYKGSFKLHLKKEDRFWCINYFTMPGFTW